MTTGDSDLLAFLRQDTLRHITPLKMYALYGAAMRVIPVRSAGTTGAAGAFVLLAPREASQYDQTHYADMQWVVFPALPANADAGLVDACAGQIIAATDTASFVVKTIDGAIIDALGERLGSKRVPQYRRALCTFGWPGGSALVAADARLHVTDVLPAHALPLLRAHGVYSARELETLFADGAARCHLRVGEADAGATNVLGVLLTFPNTPAIHEIGSLHVRTDARRAGHARALLKSALADLQARKLTARYVVDAANEPSIALAGSVGLRERFRLAHWAVASA